MEKVAIFFGSSTGNTEAVANQIATMLDADVLNVADNPADKLETYENLIFGTSTWGLGDLQDDWEDFVTILKSTDLDGKVVAFFGLGDSDSYADNFTDGMGILYKAVKDKGCKMIGAVDTEGYEFDNSESVVDGKFVGLALDEDNQGNLTTERIKQWVESIKADFK